MVPSPLAVSQEYNDPTEPPGQLGSYTRNGQEPEDSRKAPQREGPFKQSIEVGKLVKEEWYKEQVPQELRDIGDHDYQIRYWGTDFSTG